MRRLSVLAAVFAILGSSGVQAANQVTDYYDDPFAYCTVAGTVDQPGSHYTGPMIPEQVIDALASDGVAFDEETRAFWRCADGKVLACAEGPQSPLCANIGDNPNIPPRVQAFCQEHPGQDVYYDNYVQWHCEDTQPTILARTVEPDPQGYNPMQWIEVASSRRPPTGTASAGQSHSPLDQIQGTVDCEEPFHGTGAEALVRLEEQSVDIQFFSSQIGVDRLLEFVLTRSREFCEQQRNEGKIQALPVRVVVQVAFGQGAPHFQASYDGSTWFHIMNYIGEEFERRQSQEQAQQRAQAQAAIDGQRIREGKQQTRQTFIDRFSVDQLVEGDQFSSNPFVFINQTVGVQMSFNRMIEQDKAVFTSGNELFLLDRVPAAQFTLPNQLFVVAVTSRGTQETTALGSTITLPYGELVGVYPCQERGCREFYD